MSYGIVGGGPDFAIPPNEANYKSPPFDLEFTADVDLVEFMPHMHVRGKDMTYHLVYPDGRDRDRAERAEVRLQLADAVSAGEADRGPKGTRMYVDAHYDNSVANRSNPNPNRTVYLGRMTWEEMMAPFFGVLIDANADPNAGAQARAFRSAGRRCLMRRAMWNGYLIALVAASTIVATAQTGGKPISGGNPTPGTAQPDPPNLADRITVTGCLQPAPTIDATSHPDANTPVDTRYVLASAQRVNRLPPGTGGSELAKNANSRTYRLEGLERQFSPFVNTQVEISARSSRPPPTGQRRPSWWSSSRRSTLAVDPVNARRPRRRF